MNESKDKRLIIIWLLTGCILITAMVVIGGITRLTQSGLSIVEWDLVSGTIAPTSEEGWEELFAKYQDSPQYKLVNHDFTLEDFKSIFWWEYIHRLLGRIIGLVFFIPFVIFLIRRSIPRELVPKLLLIFFLGGLQGALGWFMVKSGLINEPRVSHYRLAAHLITAFITFGFTFYVALGLSSIKKITVPDALKRLLTWSFFILCIQIIYGAFVAGTRAGYFFNTWPKMNGEWIAEAVTFGFEKDGILALMENPAVLQFVHRALAIVVYLLLLFLVIKSPRGKAKNFASGLFVLGNIQFVLGVFTLISQVPVSLGVLHQLGAFLLFTGFVFGVWYYRKA